MVSMPAATLQRVDWLVLLAPYVCYWVTSAFFEIAGPRWLSRYAIQPGGHDDSKKQLVSRGRVLATVLLQHAMMIAANWALVAYVDGSIAGRPWPSWTTCVTHFVLGMLMLDGWLYWMHRLFHRNRFLYQFHAWHHSIHAPYAFSAMYNHPVEGVLLDLTSGALPLLLLRMDARVAAALFTLTNVKIVDDHCGYALPWDLLQRLFPNNARFHDLHHVPKFARFNLSQPFFTHWDKLGGTLYRGTALQKKCA